MPTIGGTALRNASRVGEREAIVTADRCWTWRELETDIARAAAGLEAFGVGKGDRVAILSSNSAAFIIAAHAASRLGAIVVPVNTRLAAPEVAHIMNDSESKLLAFGPGEEDLAGSSAGQTPLVSLGPSACHPDLLAGAYGEVHEDRAREDDDAFILYTSGTTGKPKGAMFDHHRAVWAAMAQIVSLGLRDGDRYLPSSCADVPLRWHHLHERDDTAGWDTHRGAQVRSRYRVGDSRAMPGHMAFRRPDHVPADAAPARRSRPLSSGHVAQPFIEARVVDAHGDDTTPDEVGELVFRGEAITKGYWNNSQATAEVIRDGWLHTGDLMRVYPDGAKLLVDRLRDVIITGGRNVYSAEVEQAIADHPDVDDVAVVGRPDDVWGETVVAVVTARPGSSLTLAAIREHCASRIADYKAPREVVSGAVPRNGVGKVQKHLLRHTVSADTSPS